MSQAAACFRKMHPHIMNTIDINFDNMGGKPLRHVHTPADKASVTFVFEDGMRRSFGVACAGDRSRASVRALVAPNGDGAGAIFRTEPFEGGHRVVVTEVRRSAPGADTNLLRFYTDKGDIDIEYFCEESMSGHLVELPE